MDLFSSRGQRILISPEDIDLARWRWYLSARDGYFIGYSRKDHGGDGKMYPLHTLILRSTAPPPSDGRYVADHRDRDKANNQRENLRWVTYTQSNWNRRGSNRNGYKGVIRRYNCKTLLYEARLETEGKVIYLGGHRTAEEAARAYDVTARQYGGEHAFLNFP